MASFFELIRDVRRGRLVGWTLIAIGISGLFGTRLYAPATHVRAHIVESQVVTKSAPKPTVKEVAAYAVPPSDPKFIAIPAIDLGNTPILAFGLSATGTIATPNSIYETGWFDGSSKPGQAGVMFIYGHIASFTPYSVFAKLHMLRPGDEVIITRGDNTIFRYQVTGSETYPYNAVDMSRVLTPASAGIPALNLMTCAGQIITVGGVKEYSQRLVIFTQQI